jgi:hypothetical protein
MDDLPTDADSHPDADDDPYLAVARRLGWRPPAECIDDDLGIWWKIAMHQSALGNLGHSPASPGWWHHTTMRRLSACWAQSQRPPPL